MLLPYLRDLGRVCFFFVKLLLISYLILVYLVTLADVNIHILERRAVDNWWIEAVALV